MKAVCMNTFKRIIHGMFCFFVAFSVLLASVPGYASEKPLQAQSKNAPLKAIQTYELLDILAAHHGKIILVNFFAAFCGPCRREIPELMQLRKEIPEEELVIIGVAIDRDIREAENFVKSLGVQGVYPVFYGGEDLSRAYRINAIPFNVIYNRKGHIEVSEPGYVPGPEMKQFLMDLIRR